MKLSRRSTQKRTFWQRRGVWALILVLLLSGGAGWYFFGGGESMLSKQTAPTAPSFHTATVRRGNIQIAASGSATLISDQTVDLSFSTKGTVSELNVKLGDIVKTGQVLARLGNAGTQEANLAALQLQLLQSQQTLTTLQQNASVSLAQAYQDWITAQQTYNTAADTQMRTTLQRCSKQVRTKYAAALTTVQQKFDDMTKWNKGSPEWVAAKSAYDTALANYNYCSAYTQDEKNTAQTALDLAKLNMQQAETKYNTLKSASGIDPNQLALDEAKVNQLQAQLTNAQQDLSGITLTSPIDGKVVFVAGAKGTAAGTAKFITIADVSHPTVQVSLDETDLSRLTDGTTAQVVFDALPDQTFTGKVVQIQPELVKQNNIQVAQGTVELDPNTANITQNLPLGLNGSVTVIDKQAQNTLLVPNQALKDLGNQEYAVFVVGGDGQLLLKPVKVGIMDSTHAEIISGLKEGDVVSTGTAQTTNGS